MNAEFIKVLENSYLAAYDNPVNRLFFGPPNAKAWTAYITRMRMMDRVIDDLPFIPPANYKEYIWAVNCVAYGGDDDSCQNLLMFIYEIFMAVTTLTLYETYDYIHAAINAYKIMGCPQIAAIYIKCNVLRGCLTPNITLRELIAKYLLIRNNERIHGIWHEWDDDSSLATWLPREMIQDVVWLLGDAWRYDERHRIQMVPALS